MRAFVLLLAGVAVLSACVGGGKFKQEFAPGAELYQVDGVLSVEITQVENVTGGRNKKLIVTMYVRNLSDKEIRFKRDDVMLELAFGAVRAKDAVLWNQEIDVDVKPGESKKKVFAFEGRERTIDAGTYNGVIRGINYFDGGTLTPAAAELVFTVKATGPATDPAPAPATDPATTGS